MSRLFNNDGDKVGVPRARLDRISIVTKLTLNIIIKRLDKSKHRHFEVRDQPPRRGDILETVVAGRLIKAEVDVIFPERIVVGPSRTWIVHAEEI